MLKKRKFILKLILMFSYMVSQVEEVGDSMFTVIAEGHIVNLPYFSNESNYDNLEDVKRAVIVLHGQNRNANDYFEYIQDEIIETPIGNFNTMKFSLYKKNKQETFLWCAYDLDFLPIKVITKENDGVLSKAIIKSINKFKQNLEN